LRLLAPLLLIALLLPAVALADAVPGPPENCPRGATGTTSHEGTWCAPTTCASDTDCWEGRCTQDIGLCVTSQQIPCGGRGGWDPNCKVTQSIAHRTCRSDKDCATGTCEVASRCAMAWNPLRGRDVGCGGCSAAEAGLGGLLTLGGMLLGLLLRRRQLA
jgi:uncharacterized protein (TIGR03382 family)